MAFLKAILETVLKAAVTGVAGFAGVMLGKKLVKRKESKKLSKENKYARDGVDVNPLYFVQTCPQTGGRK